MLPLASRRRHIEHALIISYAVAVAMTTIVATTAVGALRCARERRLRAGAAAIRRKRLGTFWRR